jgi:hypothetical protein
MKKSNYIHSDLPTDFPAILYVTMQTDKHRGVPQIQSYLDENGKLYRLVIDCQPSHFPRKGERWVIAPTHAASDGQSIFCETLDRVG